ncbi:tRNA pseudouridine(38-40) synthase TruA [Pedobacter sp. SD-b]|uniref:tRNA pseudouridine synthase A n=1 Tax=Pedobacter segetis TaxID=2793069 RepID=A0ABS1BGK5_9SPHI|nr:tRNA pseudouridine(38-40) synthase TruA [Pedobacter segetis]MBK0381977.1 tRNA pseudouridine(38-40) synthase TruA [Pedobacter segetis]
MRYYFHIGYVGANYSGWQKNGKYHSVQKVLEDGISQILKVEANIIGCGRTDAKVNASQYFFHLDVGASLEERFLFKINKLLPTDISVFDIIEMEGQPHARFDATQRKYDYFIHTYKDPFLASFSALYLNLSLDFEKLKSATALLLKYKDYRPFCTSPDKNEHTICHISSAKWLICNEGKRLRFQLSSNRFLSKMIRIIVGQLLKVGEGKLALEEFEGYLKNLETPKILSPAHPQGLYLSKITYPYLDIPPKTDFFNLDGKTEKWEEI